MQKERLDFTHFIEMYKHPKKFYHHTKIAEKKRLFTYLTDSVNEGCKTIAILKLKAK